MAADYDELVDGADATQPQVVVTDIRMPPNFQDEGIEAAKEVRKRHPGTGVVILSQYDDPEYAISLLSEGAAGYAYLLKDRVSDGNRLARAIREVATGGSMLDPEIVQALVAPVRDDGELTDGRGRAAAPGRRGPAGEGDRRQPGHHARGGQRRRSRRSSSSWPRARAPAGRVRCGGCGCCRRRSSTARSRARRSAGCCRAAWPSSCATTADAVGRTERLVVTVLMSDVRGYSGIAERTDPTVLGRPAQRTHRREMNAAILDEGGTVMQYVGDAVMAVFGAPFPQEDHADRALRSGRRRCTGARPRLNAAGRPRAWPRSASASACRPARSPPRCSGSDERLEYTVVGDTVNLAQRLQDLARPAGTTVLSEATVDGLSDLPRCEPMPPQR